MEHTKDTIVIFSGGFDPVHSGHIELIKEAQQLGRVILALNSDDWLRRKKGKEFLAIDERKAILSQFKGILAVIEFDDADDSACDAISQVKKMFPNHPIIFANGGDRIATNTPEMINFEHDPLVTFEFGLGGSNKKNSSSWILQNWKSPTEKRVWGDSMTYHDTQNAKVKRLILKPGKSISMQYHNHRSEFWFVENGIGTVTTIVADQEIIVERLKQHTSFFVDKKQWHKLYNKEDTNLEIIEIQYGTKCSEADIVRK